MLNATWLETFTTLCEVGHFTHAAQRLGMTQPGVSQHLRKLENQVGKPLIQQVGKSFSLTPAGEAVFSLGNERRIQERNLRNNISHDNPNIGELSIGCSGSFAMWVYPALLEHMQHAPELIIRVTAAPHDSIKSDVLNGALDLGIVMDNPNHPRLHATLLASEELCLVVPRKFAKDTLNLQRLDDLGFVAHPDGVSYANDLLGLNFPDEFKGGDHLRVRTFINQMGQILAPVAHGLGYTILPKTGIAAFPDQKNLAIVPLRQKYDHELWMISRTGRTKFARVAAIANLISRTVKALNKTDD